ncbi:MAG: diguanylate cyclase [Pseudomonadota bacterium]
MKLDSNNYETRRLESVKNADILDTPPESDYDNLVKLAALIFHVPMSTITIVDSHRQWFKAAIGVAAKETDRDISFCTHIVDQNKPLIVENTSEDVRFSESPLVRDEPNVAFYAGVPLCTSDNLAIGTFCIMDNSPRKFSAAELETLRALANQAMKLLELRIQRKKLTESERRWKFALEGAGHGVWDWDIKADEIIFDKQWKVMLGYSENDVIKNLEAFRQMVHPEDVGLFLENLDHYLNKKIDTYRVELRLQCKDKSWKWILTRGLIVSWDKDGAPLQMIGTHTDISKRKLSEEIVWKQANFDLLTGLPNRRMFFDRLEKEIARSARENQSFALMFIDLDGFKLVNDQFGHQIGDQLLMEVSNRMTACIRESDTLARLGGDEFTILVNNIVDSTDVATVADKILASLCKAFILDGNQVNLSASIGICIYPQHGLNADALISAADNAMYEAKDTGKNAWKLFS